MVQGIGLCFIFFAVMGFLLVSLRRSKIPPFLLLLVAAFGAGLAAGINPPEVSRIVARGFGGIVEKIGIVIVAGAIIGIALERSGATRVLIAGLLKTGGAKRPALTLSILGYLVAVPVFCDTAFIIFAPLAKLLAKRTGTSPAMLTTALATGLYATCVLVPPTPGPLAAALVLGADFGIILMMGLVVALGAAAAGYLWATRGVSRLAPAGEEPVSNEEIADDDSSSPAVLSCVMPLLIPLLLIALKTAANCPGTPLGTGTVKLLVDFAGEPMVALLLGVAACFRLVPKEPGDSLPDWVNMGLKAAAPIVLITAAGGALGGMFAAVGIGNYLGAVLLPCKAGIFLPFIVAAGFKTFQGSSLAALVTASTIVFPSLGALGLAGPVGAVLAALAIGAGAMLMSHVNDTYFWIVAQFSGLEAELVCKTFTAATLIMGLVSMVLVWLLTLILL